MKVRLAIIMAFFFYGGQNLKSQGSNRPNILLIFCDDLNFLGNGSVTDPILDTPHIDSLYSESIAFMNAHANAALCSPSRASVFSGVLPQTSGFYGYRMSSTSWLDNPYLSATTSLFKQLKENGYEVYGSGKIYHARRIRLEDFDDYYSEPDQGPYPYDLRIHSDLPQEFQEVNLSFSPLENIPSYPEYTGWINANGSPFFYESDENRDLMGDELTVAYCDSILTDYASRDREKPFFLTAGIYNPHEPYHVPQRFWDKYDTSQFNYALLQPDIVAPVVTSKTNRFNASSNEPAYDLLIDTSPDDDPKSYFRSFVHGYYASISYVDERIGDILQSLKNNGLEDNTIVILTSDHGVHLGSKGMVRKYTMWNDATLVPFMFKIPGVDAKTFYQPVSLVDLYPTILDLTNTPEPSSHVLDGQSLLSLYHGAQGKALLSTVGIEYLELNEPAEVSHAHHAICFDRYKYVNWSSGEDELYDLSQDPRETDNLASETAYQTIRNGMYGLLRETIGPIRKPLPDYESLFYGDFEQDLNGWFPSDTNEVFQLSSGDANLPSRHLIIAQSGTSQIKNPNLRFTDPGEYRLVFSAYSESEEARIEVRLATSESLYFDAEFEIESDLNHFALDFTLPPTLPERGESLLSLMVLNGSNIHLDDMRIINLEKAAESSIPCEEASSMATDLPINQLDFISLGKIANQKTPACGTTSGAAPQVWLSITPELNNGLIACKGISGTDPLIEVYADCSGFSSPISCQDGSQGAYEFLYLEGLSPGTGYKVRISEGANSTNLNDQPKFAVPLYVNPFPIELTTSVSEFGEVFLELEDNSAFQYPIQEVEFRFIDLVGGDTTYFSKSFQQNLTYPIDVFDGLPSTGNFEVAARYKFGFIDIMMPFGGPILLNLAESDANESPSFHVHPNPLPEGHVGIILTLDDPDSFDDDCTIEVLDMMGRRIYYSKEKAGSQIRLDEMPELSAGTYIVSIIGTLGPKSNKYFLVH